LCKCCRREITQAKDLEGHFGVDENTGKYYCCNQCGKQISNFKSLVKHFAREHSNNTNYQCSVCRELDSNEPTGIGYACFMCDLEFDIPRELEDHMHTHDTVDNTNSQN
jgi:uncharacterized CHY-type Zn-finger protein